MKTMWAVAGMLAIVLGGAGPAPPAKPAAKPAPAAADPDHPAWARPYAGRWTLSGGGEGDPVCGLTLGSGLAIGGADIDVSATCRRNYPFEDVIGWRLEGRSIVLIDAVRHAVSPFTPGPQKSWSATLPPMPGAQGERAVFLERGAPDKPKSLRALFNDEGTFTLSGPNDANACGFAASATSATGGKIDQEGRCAKPWKGKRWATWQVTGDVLTFKDRKGGVILTMKRADEYSFIADGPSGPVFFGPGVIDGSEMLEHK
jgi:hypothetical protein